MIWEKPALLVVGLQQQNPKILSVIETHHDHSPFCSSTRFLLRMTTLLTQQFFRSDGLRYTRKTSVEIGRRNNPCSPSPTSWATRS